MYACKPYHKCLCNEEKDCSLVVDDLRFYIYHPLCTCLSKLHVCVHPPSWYTLMCTSNLKSDSALKEEHNGLVFLSENLLIISNQLEKNSSTRKNYVAITKFYSQWT